MLPQLTNTEIHSLDIDHSRVHGILIGCKLTLRCVLNSPEMQRILVANRLKSDSLLSVEDAIASHQSHSTSLIPHPLHPRPQRRLRTVIYLLFAKYTPTPADD
ncbi:MAG TPA: hypothetical protein VK203_06005, partial [Nostocaceae cyanobacterium]|nr:hypothetical protein [Nostocaceae cyanobacterium]